MKPSLERWFREIYRRRREEIIARTYLSTSFVGTTGDTLSDRLPISFSVELCNSFGKEDVFMGRPRSTGNPFSHTVAARKGQRRVPERQLETSCLTRKPAKTFK